MAVQLIAGQTSPKPVCDNHRVPSEDMPTRTKPNPTPRSTMNRALSLPNNSPHSPKAAQEVTSSRKPSLITPLPGWRSRPRALMAFPAPISVRGTIDPRQPAFKTEGLIQTEPGRAKDGGAGVFPAECTPQHPDWWHLSGSRTRGPFTRMGPLPSLGHTRSWLCSPNCINAKDWPRRVNLPPQVCHPDDLISSLALA